MYNNLVDKYKCILFFFQCTHDSIDEGNSTLHLQCHGSSRDTKKMRQYLATFLKEHVDFLLQISSDILLWKKIHIDGYINYIISENQPLDKIAICCFARMYHLHIGIIMDTMYWATHRVHNIQKCDKLLGFMGGLKFVGMKWKTTPVTPDNSSSEEDDVAGTSGIDKTDPPHGNIQSNYNLRPRKVQETTHASTPELEGYNLRLHDKKPLPAAAKKSPRQSKPKSNPAKPGKVVFRAMA